ncbi:hypothetical protein D6C76_07782 [Aureobasidium pullulans]|nr:hypothetical protein D6C76_07782 [Aureobasidium pullulans]
MFLIETTPRTKELHFVRGVVSVNRSSSYPSAPETEEHWHQRAELREKKRQAKKRQDEATAYYREHPKERPLASRLTGNRLRFPKEPPPGAEIPQPTLSDTFPPLSSTATRDQSTASDFSTSTGEQAAGMALAPKFAGQALSGSLGPNHTLELFLDYVCPFSKKQFETFYHDVAPIVEKKYSKKLQVIFRQQIQPWHPSSTLVHEAAVAVLRTDSSKFWPFSAALFRKQTDFFDVKVVNETRNRTYQRLAQLAAGVGLDEDEIYAMLKISDQPGEDGSLNTGNQVTNDLKLLIKAGRLVGVHVSPTVMFNGLAEPNISSSFSKKDWEEWLQKNVV